MYKNDTKYLGLPRFRGVISFRVYSTTLHQKFIHRQARNDVDVSNSEFSNLNRSQWKDTLAHQ